MELLQWIILVGVVLLALFQRASLGELWYLYLRHTHRENVSPLDTIRVEGDPTANAPEYRNCMCGHQKRKHNGIGRANRNRQYENACDEPNCDCPEFRPVFVLDEPNIDERWGSEEEMLIDKYESDTGETSGVGYPE